MVEALTRGDNVVTSGGIVGKIIRVIDNEKAEVEIADNVNVQVIKSTITQVLSKTEPKD
jgi:preprotein translocase subunit YajC